MYIVSNMAKCCYGKVLLWLSFVGVPDVTLQTCQRTQDNHDMHISIRASAHSCALSRMQFIVICNVWCLSNVALADIKQQHECSIVSFMSYP